jgi:hypothetical protein
MRRLALRALRTSLSVISRSNQSGSTRPPASEFVRVKPFEGCVLIAFGLFCGNERNVGKGRERWNWPGRKGSPPLKLRVVAPVHALCADRREVVVKGDNVLIRKLHDFVSPEKRNGLLRYTLTGVIPRTGGFRLCKA